MRNTTPIVIIVAAISIIVIVFLAKSATNTPLFTPQSPNLIIYTISPTAKPVITATPVITEIPYPKPTSIPTLRPYDIDKSGDIWHAQDPSSYITPDNEWVKYYSVNPREVQIDYIPDNQNPDDNYADDYWQNPDYTLLTMQGDCEDISIVKVSIHRALGHKAVVVVGELWFNDGTPNMKDFWYEE